MKLTRLRIEQFRQFRQPLEIRDLADGINLFSGPNEAGKSTIVAAIRAAFFERHRSGSVDDLRPWGDGSASPSVELDFELGGTACRLHKSFLGRKRCSLQVGTQQLDGADAEDRLAELLGFRHAGRGASAAEHWGIPGLLWIEQGAAHDIRDPVAHATDHLRGALNASLGEVASSGGDEVTDQVEALRNELLTPANASPRGAYGDALRQEAELATGIAALDGDIATYRQKVDRLAALRREHDADEAEKPWLEFRAKEQAARIRLDEASTLAAKLAEEQRRARQIEDTLTPLRAQLDGFAMQEQTAARRRTELDTAGENLRATQALVQQWRSRNSDAGTRYEQARLTLNRARQRDIRQTLTREQAELQRRLEAAVATLRQADAEHGRLRAAQQQMAATGMRAADLTALRDQQRQIRELRLRQDATATRLSFTLDEGRSITIDTDTVRGSGERLLVEATTVTLPGLGRLNVAPGGTDLADLGRQEAALCDSHAALLLRLGVDSLETAEARTQTHAQHQSDARTAEAALKAHAPQGLDALRAAIAALEARSSEITAALGRLPDDDDTGTDLPGISEAESLEVAARASAADSAARLAAAELAAGNAQAVAEAAAREQQAAQAALDAPDRAARLAAAQAALLDARAGQAEAAASILALGIRCAEARTDILAQDVERFGRSAEQLEKSCNQRRDELTRLDVELQTAGAMGLDERRAGLARDHAQAVRRVDQLRRRAAALDHLLSLLRDKRRRLTQKLQAPLQKHLNHYLQLLFPQARLEIDENLSPGQLTRSGGNGQETGDFEALSFGAREQMGVICRLAYADLLREAGRPTLIILDDALVHSDEARLTQMKRVLFDAATRHQILLFTCHPANWRDLGVGARSLDDLRAG
jgi:chromosome segregation ATPase